MANLLNQKLGHTRPAVVVVGADGALPLPNGWTVVYITKGSAAALTLGIRTWSKTACGWKLSALRRRRIPLTTRPGRVSTAAAPVLDVATFGAAIGNNLVLSAYNGEMVHPGAARTLPRGNAWSTCFSWARWNAARGGRWIFYPAREPGGLGGGALGRDLLGDCLGSASDRRA